MSGAAGLLACGVGSRACAQDSGVEVIPLWENGPPDGGGPQGPLNVSHYGAISNIAVPVLQVFRPSRPGGTAVLVAGGGGYRRIGMRRESVPAAMWLNRIGITAFVLTYRLPCEGWTDGREVPFQDAQRAVRIIRGRASSFGIRSDRIGALGFSAGGHLMGMRSVRPDWNSYRPVDKLDSVSDDFNFSMLLYPVITLEPPYQNTLTRRCLVGNMPSAEESRAWSVQSWVRRDAPPFFLAQAADDPIVNAENTEIFEKACRNAGVPVVRHLFARGGHGFGMGLPGGETVSWPGMAEAWMRERQLIA
ncbi:alpha/beta hydrolase [Acetobacter sp. AN02]|uniref:alpha/beta hydrolase n=1 Tax=Acetobacter sp. AN02 TaxID=2894186 RepID=UPI0024342B8C|nr:alpha/beta hydrolase [Acetobacter sp. AN02]MDG6095630.1 alpha/beta hydrolase [Acetobacter sp. AN02]